ncbi:branched-chain amino acid aminotransferase [Georgenia sp. TF02-10]|uniref:branched-chain amino acid aminotransferase n=1 Tax=Georgenia sp. TF02-10 TaxID=2917725 RepID=UPI001FA7C7C5|nr:branched-chain amino acid aminotransferase [Georgenia sp. TF02-10]UNX53903.1 branched-chain amino acid aminotransferase [Georgenia sp. TF02-10]
MSTSPAPTAPLTGPDAAELPAADALAGRFPHTPAASPATAQTHAEVMGSLTFGVAFTDHMARARWTADAGWHDHGTVAFAPIALSPAAAVLHYGQQVFEGLKAYRHADGSVWTFRPGFNAARFNASARRLALPELPAEDFVASLAALVAADRRWVPETTGASLYLRPFMIATEPFLGVRAAREVAYLLIASPVGPYFTQGFTPVAIWVAADYHRVGPGGMGAAKTGGNYAASLLPQQEAYDKGFEQVCYLDAATNTYLEELGGMNLFVVDDDGAVRTPALTGTILEGGTRASILDLLRADGREVREEMIDLAGLLDDIRAGRVREAFACGTAAVVTPIGRLAGEGFDVTVGDGTPGPTTTELYTTLTDIQYGRRPDPAGWMYRLA